MYCQYKLCKYESKQSKTNSKYTSKYTYYKNMVGGFNSVPFQYVEALDSFINSYNKHAEEFNSTVTDPKDLMKIIDPSHGLEHMLMVLCHAEKAIEAYKKARITNPELVPIPEQEELNVKLAALYHDIDDSKYFPDSVDFANARNILASAGLEPENIDKVIQMISWVSSSKNGDRIPEEVSSTGKYFLLYPRYADRLEALGIIGLDRTYKYTKKEKEPFCITQAPKPGITIQDIYRDIATPERYASYSGKSISMMDHFYDKLLRLGEYPISNTYFDAECAIRQKPLEDFAVKFERQGNITEDEIKSFIAENERDGVVCGCNCEVGQYMIDSHL